MKAMDTQKIEIGSSTIFRTLLIVLGFWFLFMIKSILLMLIGAFVIASAIEPLARRLQEFHIPRAISVVVVYLIILIVLAAAVVLIAPALAQETAQLAHSLPDVWLGLQERLGQDSAALR